MHWYDKNGKLHECGLREARKEGYAPSVTTVIHEFTNSYGLDLYKAKQMFMASLTLPRPEGITDNEYFEIVKRDSEVHSEKAKAFGATLHWMISDLLKNNGLYHYQGVITNVSPINNELLNKKAKEVYNWIKENKESVIVDYKTQETKDGKFRQPYNEWLFQLCGYYHYGKIMFQKEEYVEHPFSYESYKGYLDGDVYLFKRDEVSYGGTIDYAKITTSAYPVKLINIIISSNEDIPIKIYEWKQEKIAWGLSVFLEMVILYRLLKKL